MKEKTSNLPNQKELEKELADYLSRKYGEKVKVVSAGVFAQSEEAKEASEQKLKDITKKFDFDITPQELIAYLDQYVVKQDEAKAVLATKICTHFNRVRYSLSHPLQHDRVVGRIKNNVLLIGPTGVGKTFLIKLIAQRLGVPFVKGDATKFSETGYVGGDVEDLVRDLVREADGDVEKAQYGIIYVDEIDKIASTQFRIGADVSRAGVQRALLKPMEETEVEMKVAHDPISQIEAIEQYRQTGKREKKSVNTKNILFIMSGAFAGLDEIIRKRTQHQSIGFEGSLSSKKGNFLQLKKVASQDLIEFGFESEFIGRLPVIAVLEELSEADLFTILQNVNSSLVVAKRQDFLSYGIHLLFTQEALQLIARRAYAQQTGARGLVSVLERVLMHFEKSLPSCAINQLAVTAAMVENPRPELEQLLHEESAREANRLEYERLAAEECRRLEEVVRWQQGDFLEEFGIAATPARISLIARQSLEENLDVRDLTDLLIDRIDQIHRFSKQLSGKCDIEVKFSDEAIDRLLSGLSLVRDDVVEALRQLQKDYEYGLCLLSQKRGVDSVIVPEEGIVDPKKYMEDLIAQVFKL
jgi:ATP-dependent Clp protease ATP-binding subunit ClpX